MCVGCGSFVSGVVCEVNVASDQWFDGIESSGLLGIPMVEKCVVRFETGKFGQRRHCVGVFLPIVFVEVNKTDE